MKRPNEPGLNVWNQIFVGYQKNIDFKTFGSHTINCKWEKWAENRLSEHYTLSKPEWPFHKCHWYFSPHQLRTSVLGEMCYINLFASRWALISQLYFWKKIYPDTKDVNLCFKGAGKWSSKGFKVHRDEGGAGWLSTSNVLLLMSTTPKTGTKSKTQHTPNPHLDLSTTQHLGSCWTGKGKVQKHLLHREQKKSGYTKLC